MAYVNCLWHKWVVKNVSYCLIALAIGIVPSQFNHIWRGSVTFHNLILLRIWDKGPSLGEVFRLFKSMGPLVMIVSRFGVFSHPSLSLKSGSEATQLWCDPNNPLHSTRRVESRSARVSVIETRHRKGGNRDRQSEKSSQLSRTFVWIHRM